MMTVGLIVGKIMMIFPRKRRERQLKNKSVKKTEKLANNDDGLPPYFTSLRRKFDGIRSQASGGRKKKNTR